MKPVLALHYLPSIQWFAHYLTSDCIIDLHENYVKQSYRNRARILTANGPFDLIANVIHPAPSQSRSMREVRLDHTKRWFEGHWKSIRSAYANSPYFPHYEGLLGTVYSRRYDRLADLNLDMLEVLIGIICPDRPAYFSEKYVEVSHTGEFNDLRGIISPKTDIMQDREFTTVPYWQVFSDRFGFVANLSVLDLVMCEGPRAGEILRACIVDKSNSGPE